MREKHIRIFFRVDKIILFNFIKDLTAIRLPRIPE